MKLICVVCTWPHAVWCLVACILAQCAKRTHALLRAASLGPARWLRQYSRDIVKQSNLRKDKVSRGSSHAAHHQASSCRHMAPPTTGRTGSPASRSDERAANRQSICSASKGTPGEREEHLPLDSVMKTARVRTAMWWGHARAGACAVHSCSPRGAQQHEDMHMQEHCM